MPKSSAPSAALFPQNIKQTLVFAANMLGDFPASRTAFLRVAGALPKANKTRDKLAREGVTVPPMLIVGTTGRCNLRCEGCYACEQAQSAKEEISAGRAKILLDEAVGLGVSVVLLAGGEPLLSAGWLDSVACCKDILGLMFTNGTLMDDERLDWLNANRHIVPIISIEGGRAATDARRGDGVFDATQTVMGTLSKRGIPFGVSITLTQENYRDVLCDGFTQEYLQKGCRLFVYVEYVPVAHGTEPLTLASEAREHLIAYVDKATHDYNAVFLPFPGDEEAFGGCLAAGRGFAYISPNGDLEPCPFAPFSDVNVKTATLREAFASPLLSSVRANHHLLKEGAGGCALWANRAEVERFI